MALYLEFTEGPGVRTTDDQGAVVWEWSKKEGWVSPSMSNRGMLPFSCELLRNLIECRTRVPLPDGTRVYDARFVQYDTLTVKLEHPDLEPVGEGQIIPLYIPGWIREDDGTVRFGGWGRPIPNYFWAHRFGGEGR